MGILASERVCDKCGAAEGRKRPVGRYIVELHTLEDNGENRELCMTCYMEERSKSMYSSKQSNLMDKLKGFFHF